MRSLAIVLLLAGGASAEDIKPQPTHTEGEYGGVEPGHAQKADPGKKPKKPPPKGTLAWIGFEVKNGSSELFLQSVAAFEVSQHVEGGTLVIDLGGLSKLGQNTWRPIDTRFFDSPISRIVAARVGASKGKSSHPAGIQVRVTFKNPKDAAQGSMRTATEGDGYFYAYLTFAGGGAASMQEPDKK
jgi:hypothetical protein